MVRMSKMSLPSAALCCLLAAGCVLTEKQQPQTAGQLPINPEDCGDAQTVPDIYCFDFMDVPSVVAPKHVVGARFVEASPTRFAVFAAGGNSTMLAWENGTLSTAPLLSGISPAADTHVTAADVRGSALPDLVFTHLWGASVAPNEAGNFGALIPAGLPEAAFAEAGNTFPFDIGSDGQSEYLKGSGAELRLWRPTMDAWEPDAEGFPVPGCKIVTDLALGDFNGDGRSDVAYIGSPDTDSNPDACADFSTHGVAILLQSEVGQLQQMPLVSTSQHKFYSVEARDFDGDGFFDVATLTGSKEVLLFRSKGDGTFQPPVTISNALAFALGDFDGDGDAECVFSGPENSIAIADHVFAQLSVTLLPGLTGIPLGTGDLNNDEVDDFALLWDGVDVPTLGLAISNP